MKHRLLLFCVVGFLSFFALAEPPLLERLKAADDARVAAILAADPEGMRAVFSADLHYAHSNGVVDTRDSFFRALTEKRLRYLAYEQQQRNFTFPAPGLALMTGRARVRVASGGGEIDAVLSYLGVWREEGGTWKFLAWQSSRLPATPAEATK
jgi:hypothetical protein